MSLNWNKTIFWTILLVFVFFFFGFFAELLGHGLFGQDFFKVSGIGVLVIFLFAVVAMCFVE